MECQRYIWNWTLEMLCPDPVVELSPVLGSGTFESGQQGFLLFRAGGFGSLTEVAWGHSGVPGIWHAHSSAHTLPTKWLSRLNHCFDHEYTRVERVESRLKGLSLFTGSMYSSACFSFMAKFVDNQRVISGGRVLDTWVSKSDPSCGPWYLDWLDTLLWLLDHGIWPFCKNAI